MNINTSGGPVKFCSLWDFMKDVRIEKLMPDINPYFMLSTFSDEIIKNSTHILKQNPMSVLVELKKTTTIKDRRGKKIELLELIDELSSESLKNWGKLTHLFPIGAHRYAFVGLDDVKLYTSNYRQSLVCVVPERNFQIYAPNLKIGRL